MFNADLPPPCGPVENKTINSPGNTHVAHLMNQYCAFAVGVNSNPYWVVIGGDVPVSGTGETDSVVLGQEDKVAFKTDDAEPIVSWKNENHLIITIKYLSTIQKSIHSVGDVSVEYRVQPNLSEAGYLRDQIALRDRQRSHYPKEYLDASMARNMKSFQVFDTWAKSNASPE